MSLVLLADLLLSPTTSAEQRAQANMQLIQFLDHSDLPIHLNTLLPVNPFLAFAMMNEWIKRQDKVGQEIIQGVEEWIKVRHSFFLITRNIDSLLLKNIVSQ